MYILFVSVSTFFCVCIITFFFIYIPFFYLILFHVPCVAICKSTECIYHVCLSNIYVEIIVNEQLLSTLFIYGLFFLSPLLSHILTICVLSKMCRCILFIYSYIYIFLLQLFVIFNLITFDFFCNSYPLEFNPYYIPFNADDAVCLLIYRENKISIFCVPLLFIYLFYPTIIIINN